MTRPLLPLYLRIWLAVVLAVAALTLLAGWAWRATAEPPLRAVVVRDADGDVVGRGQRLRPPLDDVDDAADARPAQPAPPAPPSRAGEGPRRGPEFAVAMDDGRTLYVHLPRPPRAWWMRPFGFVWTLALVAVAVAVATWPIVRKLTRRLEALQRGVERWGAGDLSARADVQGHDEAAQLAARFNQAADRVQTLVQTHKSLLANASHELRSPLARIRMGLELMELNPAAHRAEIVRSLAELDQLIDEILLASRLDAQEVDIGTVELVDLVGLCAEECARTGAELDAGEAALEVPGVPRLLRRAVRNLLENARRYGGAGDVVLQLQRGADGTARVCVDDRGPGVPVSQRERIFEPFYRLPGASEREGGVGLGLALVRSIAGRHGGSVHCEDRPGGGARFVLQLPQA